MSDLNEQVLLPHPSKQRILHPMDVRDARSLFIRAWWFARLASVPIAVANGAVVCQHGATTLQASAPYDQQ